MKVLEHLLWITGCLALGYCAFLWGRAEYSQAQGNAALERIIQTGGRTQRQERSRPPEEGSLVGRIEIPRLQMSAVVFAGIGDETLDRGVGYMTSSAPPGETGNVVFAGHRDTFFRPLQNIRAGDMVSVVTGRGVFRYEVEYTEIVNPEDVDVIRPTTDAKLTLVTCYPFRYVGSAPQRFIVRARSL